MADKAKLMIPPQGGVVRDFVLRVKLILRLMGDRRVSPWLKIIPIGGLLYLISPIDLIPDVALPIIGELDDAAVLWLTNYLFVELCPQNVVQEHVRALNANTTVGSQDDVIEGEAKDVTEKNG